MTQLTSARRWPQIALSGVLLLSGWMSMPAALASYTPDEDLLSIKGYSPELINTTGSQRSRQEWKAPVAPALSPKERFFRNIFYSDWTGNIDEFGSQVIRNK